MYELYLKHCQDNQIPDPVAPAVYRKIFCTEYNLSFHRPKKDACSLCEKYKEANDETKLELRTSYEKQIKNKELARDKMASDKEKAKASHNFKSVTFDLQSVLYTPCSEVSHFYYALKFCSYNLTIFDQATKDGHCYFWTETDGKRGSDEIGTALFNYLKSLPNNIPEVCLWLVGWLKGEWAVYRPSTATARSIVAHDQDHIFPSRPSFLIKHTKVLGVIPFACWNVTDTSAVREFP
jgi:hypothetical protein